MKASTTRQGFTGRIHRGPMAADILKRDFTQVYNRAIRDKRLSRRARGLLVEMMSHQEGFGISMAALIAAGPEKKDALQSALWELEKYGYLHRDRDRNERGQLGDTLFYITDMPDGMSVEAPAPWSDQADGSAPDDQVDAPEAPEPADPQNRRSEPGTENPPLDGSGQTPRSEPKTDFPAQDFPAQENPLHKKTTSSSRREKTLSLPSSPPAHHANREPRKTRESTAAQDQTPAGNLPASSEVGQAVATAWAQARQRHGHAVPGRGPARIARDVVRLLAEGEDGELLLAAAVDMARDARWLNLEQHLEHYTPPIVAARPGVPAPRVYCGECQNGFVYRDPVLMTGPSKCPCRTPHQPTHI